MSRSSRVSTSAADPAAPLRGNFAVTFAGNALFAASQWAVLSLIAKLGGGRMLGEYALAVAIVSPIALFSHLNLRAVLATDIEGRHSFGDLFRRGAQHCTGAYARRVTHKTVGRRRDAGIFR